MKYKVLIFDLDNTLLDYDRTENYALDKTLVFYGIEPSQQLKESYRTINEENWKLFEKGEISSETLRVRRFDQFGDFHGFGWNAAEVSRNYLKFLGEGGFLLDGARPLIDDLRQDFRLVSVTNGISDVQRDRLRNAGLEDVFSPLVISDEVGFAKPDERIFAFLCEKAGIEDRREALMIGDSLSSDIRGALNAGIPCCWYNPAGYELPEGFNPDFIISNLDEIRDIVL